MNSLLNSIFSKPGKTEKITLSDDITVLKEEVLQRRAEVEQYQADIKWLQQQLWEKSDSASTLVAERDSAVAALEEERNLVKALQVNLSELVATSECHQKMSESHSEALNTEREKNNLLEKANEQQTTDYQKIEAKLEDEKRKCLERGKQILKEREQHDLIVSMLWKQIESQKKQELPKPTEPLRPNVKYENGSDGMYAQPRCPFYSRMESRRTQWPVDLNARTDNRFTKMQPMSFESRWDQMKEESHSLDNTWEEMEKELLEAQYGDHLSEDSKIPRFWDDDRTY